MNDILDEVLERLDYAKRYGDAVWGLCPFHSDSRSSFMVHADRYYCQACGAKGTTKSLLDKLSGHIARPMPDSFHNPFTKWLKQDTLANTLKLAWQQLKKHPSVYLRKRGVTDEWQINLGLGILDDWITFPIRDNNMKIIGAVARANETNPSPAKYVVPNNQDPNMIYVPDWKLFNDAVIIYATFGILDAVSLVIYGAGAFSTTNGKRLNDVSVLDKVRKRIIFLPDKGEESEAKQIAKKLGWRGAVMKVNYPDDSKDFNDLFCKHRKVINGINVVRE